MKKHKLTVLLVRLWLCVLIVTLLGAIGCGMNNARETGSETVTEEPLPRFLISKLDDQGDVVRTWTSIGVPVSHKDGHAAFSVKHKNHLASYVVGLHFFDSTTNKNIMIHLDEYTIYPR